MAALSASFASALLARPLVIGASGLVGGAFHRRLAAAGLDVHGTWHTRERPGLVRFALADDARRFLDHRTPSLVVLASALTHVDYCETHPEETFERNVVQVRPVAAWCAERDVPLLFFSTDYVFDGADGPYREDAPPAPLSVYGRSKLAAEQVVSAAPRHAILRITNVFDVGFDDRNFLVRLVDSLRRRLPITLPADQYATPTFATWLADQAMTVIERGLLCAPGAPAILNVACDDLVSRLEFARRVAAVIGADPALITGKPTAELGQAAPRPLRGGLRNDRLKLLLGIEALPLEQALAMLAPRLRELYERG